MLIYADVEHLFTSNKCATSVCCRVIGSSPSSSVIRHISFRPHHFQVSVHGIVCDNLSTSNCRNVRRSLFAGFFLRLPFMNDAIDKPVFDDAAWWQSDDAEDEESAPQKKTKLLNEKDDEESKI